MSDPYAVHIPCVSCRAPLALDMRRGAARCGHCDHEQPIAPEILTRVRAHLEVLGGLEQRVGDAKAEAAYYKRLGNSSNTFLGVIALNLALVGGGWVWFLAREALAGVVGIVLANLIMIPLAVVALLAVVAGWGTFLSYRKKMRAELSAVEVVGCDHCGASIPAAVGRALRCPFCEAELLSGLAAMRRAEGAARRQAGQVQQTVVHAQQAYVDQATRQLSKGRKFGRIWAGICFGAMASTPLTFLLEHLGVPQKLLPLGILPGVGLGVWIALWLNRRRESGSQ